MKIIFFLILLLSVTPIAFAEQLSGKVIGITDGDTLTLLNSSHQQIKIRLAEIDTPESGQPYGTRSKQLLSDLAFGKQVRVEVIDRDRYGRTVGRVFVGEKDVNADLVRQGAAWVYRKYAHDKTLFALEENARQEHRGLWALPETQRIPPWEWRHPSKQHVKAPQLIKKTDFKCGEKRYCREMLSCAEAQFYLKTCNLSRLDGDQDGVPCEKLCR